MYYDDEDEVIDSGQQSLEDTNFDDFIPEVYRIKNSCKGRLIQTKTEDPEYFSSDYSDAELPTMIPPSKQLKGQKHNSRRRKDKPYKCSMCSFVTAWKCNIIRHKLQHTRERVYGCHLCDYTALQKSNLRTHIRIHTGDKKFVCHLCEYKTMYKSTLDLHILKHKRGKRVMTKPRNKTTSPAEEKSPSDLDAHTGEKNFTNERVDVVKAEYASNGFKIEPEHLEFAYDVDDDEPWNLCIESKVLDLKNNLEVVELKPEEIDL